MGLLMRRKLKKAAAIAVATVQIHDRLATDLPLNSDTAITEVDDPFSDSGGRLRVIRSIKDDPLAGMLARSQIDRAQFEAGRMWQEYHEQSEVSGARALDTTKEKVDGGKISEPINDKRIKALKALGEAGCVLGTYDNALIWAVLGERISLADVAQRWCLFADRERAYLGSRFRDALETLARLWSLASDIDLTGKSSYRSQSAKIA